MKGINVLLIHAEIGHERMKALATVLHKDTNAPLLIIDDKDGKFDAHNLPPLEALVERVQQNQRPKNNLIDDIKEFAIRNTMPDLSECIVERHEPKYSSPSKSHNKHNNHNINNRIRQNNKRRR